MRLAFVLSLFATEAFANTITVTTTADVVANDAACSLREAVQAANTNVGVSGCTGGSGADTIILTAGTYDVVGAPEDANVSGDLDISESLTIRGVGADMTVLSGGTGALDRIIQVTATGATVSLIDLGVTHGHASPGDSGGGIHSVGFLNVLRCSITENVAGESPGAGGDGGGIWINKTDGLVVVSSVIAANSSGACVGPAPGRPGSAAGIYMRGGHIEKTLFASNQVGPLDNCMASIPEGGGAIVNISGVLSLEQSSITGNTASVGGGLYAGSALVSIRQSSFVGNTASAGGSAIHAENGDVLLENSTISGNVASGDYGAVNAYASGAADVNLNFVTLVGNVGGGLSVQGPSLTASVRNSLLSSNSSAAMATGYDCLNVGAAQLTSKGYNVFGAEPLSATRGCPSNELLGDAQQDAVIGSLVELTFASDVGNLTQYLAPRPGSRLIDAGVCTNAAAQQIFVDQRGNGRVCACDIGAVEAQKPTLRVTDVAVSTACANGPASRVEALDCAGNVTATSDVCTSTGTGTVGPAGADGATGGTGGLGAPGTQGDQGEPGRNGTKIKTEKIGTGDEACPEGGLRITVGDDANADGTLAGPEISDSQALCNPRQPSAGCGAVGPVPFAAIAVLLLLRRRRHHHTVGA